MAGWLLLDATTAHQSRNGPQESKGGVKEEGSISSSQFCLELFPKSLLKRAVPGEPVSTRTPILFPRGNAGHTVSLEDADHLHSLLYSPYQRPDLRHIYPRVSLTLKQLLCGSHGLVTRHLQISNTPLASICPGSHVLCTAPFLELPKRFMTSVKNSQTCTESPKETYHRTHTRKHARSVPETG